MSLEFEWDEEKARKNLKWALSISIVGINPYLHNAGQVVEYGAIAGLEGHVAHGIAGVIDRVVV
jgi:hypothetical protein